MTVPAARPRFEASAYLDWETEQSEKHEYLDGEVFAMAGASEAHVTLAGNVFMALRNHLRGGSCSVFISDMKLRVEADNAFFYSDVFVTCAETDHAHSHYKAAPSLVVEVLSPTTSAYDRGAKFAAYRKLPSLREYALVETERLSIDLFRRDEGGHWVLYPSEGGRRGGVRERGAEPADGAVVRRCTRGRRRRARADRVNAETRRVKNPAT